MLPVIFAEPSRPNNSANRRLPLNHPSDTGCSVCAILHMLHTTIYSGQCVQSISTLSLIFELRINRGFSAELMYVEALHSKSAKPERHPNINGELSSEKARPFMGTGFFGCRLPEEEAPTRRLLDSPHS
jgi:hypothetical protein